MQDTRIVRVLCTTACFVHFSISGTTAVAIASGATRSHYVPADEDKLFKVPSGGSMAVIRLSSDGDVYVQEINPIIFK